MVVAHPPRNPFSKRRWLNCVPVAILTSARPCPVLVAMTPASCPVREDRLYKKRGLTTLLKIEPTVYPKKGDLRPDVLRVAPVGAIKEDRSRSGLRRRRCRLSRSASRKSQDQCNERETNPSHSASRREDHLLAVVRRELQHGSQRLTKPVSCFSPQRSLRSLREPLRVKCVDVPAQSTRQYRFMIAVDNADSLSGDPTKRFGGTDRYCRISA